MFKMTHSGNNRVLTKGATISVRLSARDMGRGHLVTDGKAQGESNVGAERVNLPLKALMKEYLTLGPLHS